MYNFNYQVKKIWGNNKSFVVFIGIFLITLSIIKIIFYYYNQSLLFSTINANTNWSTILSSTKWSIYADLLVLLSLNFLFLFLLQFCKFIKVELYKKIICLFFIFCNSFTILLNIIDIFYFRFHNQRANADMLYVLDSPLQKLKYLNPLFLIGLLLLIIVIVFFIGKLHYWLIRNFEKGKANFEILAIGFLGILIFFTLTNKPEKYLLPTYPLTQLNSSELTISQNSVHTFLYSLFRKDGKLQQSNYFTANKSDSLFTIKHFLSSQQKAKKNIVLFIMESVPFEFFDSTNKNYTQLPFFSSLLQKSTFYTNAFCYSHESNKGITALLASTPTITDIPLYHSSYITMSITKAGATLGKTGYKSMFCVGDNYDDFGFAKCTNWLGFDNYYSKENLPNYKNLPSQAMGVHDEYVLDFMHQKINTLSQPFFAVNFNISTHYDYALPKNFIKSFPKNYSTAMKSMTYYDYSLSKFFDASKNEAWFKNTVFIFCSDHWMFPNEKDLVYNNVANYKIPIIIYDAGNEVKKTDSTLASQFDILPTILDISGYKGEVISYGNSLLQKERNNFAFSKINSTLYQIIDSTYALGFNSTNNNTEYLYNYKTDATLKNNLIGLPNNINQKTRLEEKIKAMLQKTSMQYGNKKFK